MNPYIEGAPACIYKHQGGSSGGTTSRVDTVCVIAIAIQEHPGFRFAAPDLNAVVTSGPRTAVMPDIPAMVLVGRPHLDDWILLDGRGTEDGGLEVAAGRAMFGGTYARFQGQLSVLVEHPVAVHDRHEGDAAWEAVHRYEQ